MVQKNNKNKGARGPKKGKNEHLIQNKSNNVKSSTQSQKKEKVVQKTKKTKEHMVQKKTNVKKEHLVHCRVSPSSLSSEPLLLVSS